jgi:hypothetical protein
MSANVEVPVKVTAWVEEGVVPLVLALDELEDVVTVASRQGGPGRAAYVRFRRRDGDVAELAVTIAGRLAAHAGGVDYELRTLQAGPSAGEVPVLELACSDRQVISLALALRASSSSRSAGTGRRGSSVRGRGPMTIWPRRRPRAVAAV